MSENYKTVLGTFGGVRTIPSNMPNWVFLDLYMGQYVSANNYETSVSSSSRSAYGAARSGKVTNDFMHALLRASSALNYAGDYTGGGFGFNKEHSFSEYNMSDVYMGKDVPKNNIVCVAYCKNNGRVAASVNGKGYAISNGAAPICLAMWPTFMADEKFAQKFSEFCLEENKYETNPGTENADLLRANACWMADYIYYEIKNGNIPVDEASNIVTLTNSRIAGAKVDTIFGALQVFNSKGSQKKKLKKAKTLDELKAEYGFDEFPKECEEYRYVVPDEMKLHVPEYMEAIIRSVSPKQRRAGTAPARNILLYGEAGVGKSVFGKMLSYCMNQPLYGFTGSSTTEPLDIIGSFVPVDNEGNEGPKIGLNEILSKMDIMPEDIMVDPASVNEKLTGVHDDSVDVFSCLTNLFSKSKNMLFGDDDSEQKFKFVEGQLIQAMRYGGVWQYDEINIPLNQGCNTALNGTMDSTQSITLPTGEVVKRHPNCIFVATMNVDMEGCQPLNQAFRSRFDIFIKMELPGDKELKKRLIDATQYDMSKDYEIIDLDSALRYFRAARDIVERKRSIDGCVSYRSLLSWVRRALEIGDAVTAAQMTIIPAASFSDNIQAELREKLYDFFAA